MPQITQLVSWSRNLNPGALGCKQSGLFHGSGEVIVARTPGEEWVDVRENLEMPSWGRGWGASELGGEGGDVLGIRVCLWQEHLGRWECPLTVRDGSRGRTSQGKTKSSLRLRSLSGP